MNMYIDVDREIARLEQIRELNQQKYVENIEKLDSKVDKISRQMDRTQSSVKREILMRQIDFYEDEIEKMDDAIEIVMHDIDEKINKIKKIKTDNEERKKKERESLDYNIQSLREAVNRGNSGEIFTMFNSVVHALDVIKAKLEKDA